MRGLAIHWSNKKKSCLSPPPISFRRGKTVQFLFLNLFCTFCEISSETWTEVIRGLVLHKIPTYATHPLQNKERHEHPTLPDLLNTLKILFAFPPPPLFFYQRQHRTLMGSSGFKQQQVGHDHLHLMPLVCFFLTIKPQPWTQKEDLLMLKYKFRVLTMLHSVTCCQIRNPSFRINGGKSL